MDRSFDHLSRSEREVVGEPEDYDWEHPVTPPPAQPRGGRSQFSMRIDPDLYDRVAALAEIRGVSFSDVVREVLVELVQGPGPATSGQMLSIGGAGRIITTGTRSTVWTEGPPLIREPHVDDELSRTSVAGS